VLTLACSSVSTAPEATIDTLPGGVVRVQNPRPSGWTDSAGITFTEIQRIQPAEGSTEELSDVWDMVVAPDGRVFASQIAPIRVAEFGVDGRFTRVLGRQGSGPGEYQVAILAFADGKLVVQDPQLRRAILFDSTGRSTVSFPTTCCIWRNIGSDTLGRIYVPVMPQSADAEAVGHGWVRIRTDGVVVDTIWRRPWSVAPKYWEFSPQPGSRSRFAIPFQPGLVDVPWAGGGMLIGDNATYSITLAPRGRDSAVVFGRPWTPAPIPEAVRQARFAFTQNNPGLKAVAHLEDIPTVAPAFDGLFVDAVQRIWVRLTVPGDSIGTTFDLFTPSGVWLGTVRAPFRARAMAFREGELVVATTDEADLPVLIRYRLGEPGRDAPAQVKLGS
jgi:hypothetical protein